MENKNRAVNPVEKAENVVVDNKADGERLVPDFQLHQPAQQLQER